MSLLKSLLFNHNCMYAKRGGVAAYHIVWIGLCLRSVPGVCVLASAVDDLLLNVKLLKCCHFCRECSTHRYKLMYVKSLMTCTTLYLPRNSLR